MYFLIFIKGYSRKEAIIVDNTTVISPSGEVLSVASSNLKSGTIVTLKKSDESLAMTIDRIGSEMPWSKICKETIGFYVGRGKSSKATCRGCRRTFDKDEVRVKTELLVASPDTRLAEISFCFSEECIQTGLRRYESNVSTKL
jgi:hypothetical protein